MKDGKLPHQQLTTKDNGLTSMQEVTYRKEFKRADSATEQNKKLKK
ncbi:MULTISPECIES: YfhE family protein [unclassified Rummeliibacillus]|nr:MULTISPECIES: YfhE family protein [unclassified Rummeliibacillus]RIJ65630.1 YfhE family protein [Rummeliibacillus sp. POC4]RPJ94586.1 YfhE family protein [Rummeliibacillus sp. TYF005]